MRHVTPSEETTFVNLIEGMNKKDKKKVLPPDPSRAIPPDPRDPRMQKIWPCYNNHVEGTWQKNPHGTWNHCQVCNVRLGYVPRSGSPGTSTTTVNPEMVKRMLMELEELLKGAKPTGRICKVMMDKIEAEVTLEQLVMDLGSTKPMKPSKAKAKATAYVTPTASSTDWENITSRGSPESTMMEMTKDMEVLLSAEEQEKLRMVLMERKAAQTTPMTLDDAYRVEQELANLDST